MFIHNATTHPPTTSSTTVLQPSQMVIFYEYLKNFLPDSAVVLVPPVPPLAAISKAIPVFFVYHFSISPNKVIITYTTLARTQSSLNQRLLCLWRRIIDIITFLTVMKRKNLNLECLIHMFMLVPVPVGQPQMHHNLHNEVEPVNILRKKVFVQL